MPTPILQTYSRTVYSTDGVTTIWNFNFAGGYLDTPHVQAYTETALGVRTDLTIVATDLIGQYQLRITPALAAGQKLFIYRNTPKNSPLVDFADGGTLSEVSLDTNTRQAIFVAAEVDDRSAASASLISAQASSALAFATAANSTASAASTNAAAAVGSAATANVLSNTANANSAAATVSAASANTAATNAAGSAATASTNAIAAANSAAVATSSAGAALWVSGTTYAQGVSVYSPATKGVFRKITASSVSSIDPSSDATNWGTVVLPGSGITNTPAGNITSATVQAAINELDGAKVPYTKNIAAGTDLNTIVTSGFYRVLGTPVNGPAGITDSQMIVSRGLDTITQIVIKYQTSVIFTRSGTPTQVGGVGTYSAWTELLNTSTGQAALGFTPVQQGTGIGQVTNLVKIGSNGSSRLKATVDNTDFGNMVFDAQLTAINTTNTPAGNIVSATVQAAINELDNAKVPYTKNIGIGVDLNTIVASGFYRIFGTPINGPVGVDDSQLIVSRGADTITQIVSAYNSNKMYVRSGNPTNVGGAGAYSAWREIYNAGSILGTVSQTAGVPTGRVIERGSNTSGEYVRFADGTQICTAVVTSTSNVTYASGAIWTTLFTTASYPLAFVNTPTLSVSTTATACWANAFNSSPTTFVCKAYSGVNDNTAFPNIFVTAVGRWF